MRQFAKIWQNRTLLIENRDAAAVSTSVSHPEKRLDLRNVSNLTSWLTGFLCTLIILDIAGFVSDALQIELLSRVRQGISITAIDADANDTRHQVIGGLQSLIYIITAVAFLKWIYRAASNARQISPQKLEFTPGWAIGWYFIPIANIWKPYHAMKEIYAVSNNPLNCRNQRTDAILPWWWSFFMLSSALSNTSFRLSMKAKEVDELISATSATLASDFISIPLAIIAIILIRRINRLQVVNFKFAGSGPT